MGNKGEITRELLITEAAKLFHKKGFRGTSISDLTAATGVKKGSLYFHFLSKDDLGLAVLEWSREKWLEFSKIALSGITPGDCLLNFFNTVVSYHRDLGFIGGCIFGNTALEMSDSDQRYVKFIDQFFSDMADMLEDFIVAAQEAGQIRVDIPANILAEHIVLTMEGGMMFARLRKDERTLRQCYDTLLIFLQLSTMSPNLMRICR
ncbi:TetR/AcrR family transcriptional regulator [Geopsychrobacter electrodiphilus]|uniref:TetR/AcrR family transcriptional regulator n=1 Tax=Geopsychrobacter electrodiphilus TaxID=225196 RepID=UPI000366527F|nr:TetR/AcrR family transcriptional regulator [Geopsychrobacter electrodiphilus]